MIELESPEAVLFDFDGTLAPNLDLADMRRQVVDLTIAAGVPEEIYTGLYIIEVIEAGAAWLDKITLRRQLIINTAHTSEFWNLS